MYARKRQQRAFASKAKPQSLNEKGGERHILPTFHYAMIMQGFG
jgi:hypothetical protein